MLVIIHELYVLTNVFFLFISSMNMKCFEVYLLVDSAVETVASDLISLIANFFSRIRLLIFKLE